MALWTLYRREVAGYFISPVAYLLLFASALCLGAYFAVALTVLNNFSTTRISVLQAMASWPPLWMILLPQIPVLTMRTFAEEFKMGTMEMLLTAPVREWEVVLAKFFGALTFFVVLWTPMFLNQVILYLFSGEHVPIIWSTTGLTFLMLFLVGMAYISIGLFTSALTRNQIVAAALCFVGVFLLFSVSFVAALTQDVGLRNIFLGFAAYDQMVQFSKGIFDTRPVVFFLSVSALWLFLTLRLLESRRGQS